MKVKVSDQGVMARSTSLENLPNCILEEIKEREEKTRPMSGAPVDLGLVSTAQSVSMMQSVSSWHK